jgi:hypothetical protein
VGQQIVEKERERAFVLGRGIEKVTPFFINRFYKPSFSYILKRELSHPGNVSWMVTSGTEFISGISHMGSVGLFDLHHGFLLPCD